MKDEARGYFIKERYIKFGYLKIKKPADSVEKERSLNTSTECGKLREMKSINSEFTKIAERRDKSLRGWPGKQGEIITSGV